MKPVDQLKLIDQNGRHLQSTMTTKDRNIFMSRFDVDTPNLSMADSKWVYVKDTLAKVDEGVIIKIDKDLELYDSAEAIFSSSQLISQLDKESMRVCKDAFEISYPNDESIQPHPPSLRFGTLPKIS